MGLVAPRHVGSSQTRARTRVPCIGRQILNHCATREAPSYFLELINQGYLKSPADSSVFESFVRLFLSLGLVCFSLALYLHNLGVG